MDTPASEANPNTAAPAQIDHPGPAGRDEAVLRFYSALGEELRAPLAALAGWIEILALSDAAGEKALAAGAARGLLRKLRGLADDARDAADAALGQLQLRRGPVDLTSLVEAVAGANPQVSLTIDSPAEVDGDSGRLFQVVETLLGTAASAGGPVEVTAGRHGAWAEVRFVTQRPLPFAALQGLFASFDRPERLGDGGSLFLCRAIAAAHGGQAGADGDESGTTLWLRLPAVVGI